MIMIDAHVHIYDCFDLQFFFDSAFANFTNAANRLELGGSLTPILLLTETARENWFQRLKARARREPEMNPHEIDRWRFHGTQEDCSLQAKGPENQSVILIAGRQIVTAENLEVLALATESEFRDGEPLKAIIEAVIERNAIPVIPWGPGKWMGKRGAILTQFLQCPEISEVFLGDNGNRPGFWPKPSHFTLAAQKGIGILPGTDPLPFASESYRPGAFGFFANASVSAEAPARDLKGILAEKTLDFQPYGRLEQPGRFFRNQVAMQIAKRMRRKAYCK